MDRFSYRSVNVAQVLMQEFPLGATTDNVLISIYDIDDSATDVNQVAMTSVTGGLFKYAWTPTETHQFRVDYFDTTLEVHYYEYISVVGTATTTPSGSSGGSTLSTLRNRFLKMIDNWNANDLTGTNSAGEVADLCINDGLQLIYSQLKDSRFMQAYGSTGLASTASQAYINLSGISDLDQIVSIKDTTNNWTLVEIAPQTYFRQIPDPTESTGTPFRYCRIFNRIYLDPLPTAVITYTTEYIKSYPRLSADADQALIDSRYDDWIMKEAHVIWMKMEDPSSSGIPFLVRERDDARQIYINDIMAHFDYSLQAMNHFGASRRYRNWKSPVDGT